MADFLSIPGINHTNLSSLQGFRMTPNNFFAINPQTGKEDILLANSSLARDEFGSPNGMLGYDATFGWGSQNPALMNGIRGGFLGADEGIFAPRSDILERDGSKGSLLGDFAKVAGLALGGAGALGAFGGGSLSSLFNGSQFVGDLPLATDAIGSSIYNLPPVDPSWGVNPQGIPDTGPFDLEGMPEYTSPPNGLPDMPNVPPMPPADPSGTNPNMVETGTPNWNPNAVTNGASTFSNILQTLGRVAPSLLGAYASSQQSSALQGLANQYMNYGAPYRDRLAASYADPSAFLQNSPDIQASVSQGTDAMARALSTKFGNPALSGTPLQELQNYATKSLYGQLGNERQRLANFGGLSALTGAAPQANMSAIGSDANIYNAIGSGISSVLNPPKTLEELLATLRQGGYSIA